MNVISKSSLQILYLDKGYSAAEIAQKFGCSQNKVNYWIERYGVKKRSIADAMYLKHNPNGDPFVFVSPRTLNEAFVYGLGIGLYWGEGNKKNIHAVRLGNVDAGLVRIFLHFLHKIYSVEVKQLRFGLQIFSDIQPQIALRYWCNELGVSSEQFHKPTITRSGSIGTYKEKSKYGVLTVYFHNKKLRDSICAAIGNLSLVSRKGAILAQLVERVHGGAKSSRPRARKRSR